MSHWADPKVLISLIAAVVLLASFVFIERRSKHALLPMRVLANRSRTGGYIVMLALATAMFGIFFFLTIFVQEVLGYSALRSGLAFLPFAVTVVLMSGVVSQLVARTGPRPLMIAGSAITAVGMYWFSHINDHSQYVSGLLGPMLVTSIGLGLVFVPISLVALTKVRPDDSGVASSLLNTGQQVGGAIGLAALGTVTWTVVSNSIKHQVSQAAAAAAAAGHHLPAAKPGGKVPAFDPEPGAGRRDLARLPGRGRDRGGRPDRHLVHDQDHPRGHRRHPGDAGCGPARGHRHRHRRDARGRWHRRPAGTGAVAEIGTSKYAARAGSSRVRSRRHAT